MKKITFFFLTCILGLSCSHQQPIPQKPKPQLPALTYYYRAVAFLEKQNLDSALICLDSAVTAKPEYAQFHFTRGQVFELKNNPDSAIAAYERAIQYKSFFPEVWKRLAALYFTAGRFDRAVAIYTEMVKNQPDSLHFHLLLADAHLANGQYKLALNQCNFYVQHSGSSSEVRRITGLAHFYLKNYPLAIQELSAYVKKFPDNFASQKALGVAQLKTGALEAGITHLNQALRINPDDAELYLYRGKYFSLHNKPQSAADQYSVALELDSTRASILLAAARFYLNQADTILAEKLLNRAILQDTHCWDCFRELGIVADEQNRPAEAYEYLKKYLDNTLKRDQDAELRLQELSKNIQ